MKDQVLPDLDQVLPETTQMPGSQRDSSTVLVPDHQKTITLIEIDDSTSSSTNSVASTSSITIRTTPKKTIQTARKHTSSSIRQSPAKVIQTARKHTASVVRSYSTPIEAATDSSPTLLSRITTSNKARVTKQTARKKTFAPKQTRVEAAMRDGLSTTSSTGVSEIFIENDIAETPGSYISISGEYDIVAIAFKRFIQRKVIG